MSSPGSGKTSTLLALKPYFEGKIKWGVMEADIDSDVDANTLIEAGIPSIQLHTGGMCHLDADMTRQGIRAFDRDELDFVVLENIGNLVCPAEFDTGANFNLTILSVPEGDDKPAKYPLMYEVSDVLVINKIDALPVFDFRKDYVEACARRLNPQIKIFYISAKTGQRLDKLFELIDMIIENQSMRIATGVLNEILAEAVAMQQPPSDKGRRLKIFYMTQISVKPPTFVVFVNDKKLMHYSYTRYIENQIRNAFGFRGTPLRFIIRERKEDK